VSLFILLVEDNPLNAELACALLEGDGHTVAHAPSADAFRARLGAEQTPDIVLMDILLPDADGVALLGELRAKERFAAIPAVAVTAQALAGETERFLAAGFDGVITKPIDTRTFAAEVARHAHERHG
jgi:CheY-like chemotaxis protein